MLSVRICSNSCSMSEPGARNRRRRGCHAGIFDGEPPVDLVRAVSAQAAILGG